MCTSEGFENGAILLFPDPQGEARSAESLRTRAQASNVYIHDGTCELTCEEVSISPTKTCAAPMAHIASLAVRSVVGGRQHQEDCCSIASVRVQRQESHHKAGTLIQQDDVALFAGIFDGHGGSSVSQLCAAHFPEALVSQLGRDGSTPTSALEDAFRDIDARILQQHKQQCLAGGSGSVDAAAMTEPVAAQTQTAGSTALVALVDAASIFTAHCGDSRAVLSRGGQAVELTRDHKPTNTVERERIERAGGQVFWNGGFRVMGVLAMSRALGDLHLKAYGVSPEPEVSCFHRTDADEFLILASDGLWDAMSNQDAVDIALLSLSYARTKGTRAASGGRLVTKALIHAAQQRGSRDNITVVFVDLKHRDSVATGAHVSLATIKASSHRPRPSSLSLEKDESHLPGVPAAPITPNGTDQAATYPSVFSKRQRCVRDVASVAAAGPAVSHALVKRPRPAAQQLRPTPFRYHPISSLFTDAAAVGPGAVLGSVPSSSQSDRTVAASPQAGRDAAASAALASSLAASLGVGATARPLLEATVGGSMHSLLVAV